MEKFIPRAKMSKKARHEQDTLQRGTWGDLCPVTRKIENKKVYNRKKVRLKDSDFSDAEPFSIANRFFLAKADFTQ